MAGISSKALGPLENKYKFNAGTELNSDFNLNLYETPFRGYDPQLGRFHQIDALADKYSSGNSYMFGFNNPIAYNDPMGLESMDDFMRKSMAGFGGTWYNNGNGTSTYYGPASDENTLSNVDVWRRNNGQGGFNTRWSDVNRQLQNNGFEGFNIDEAYLGEMPEYTDPNSASLSVQSMEYLGYVMSDDFRVDQEKIAKIMWQYQATGAINTFDFTDFIPTKAGAKLVGGVFMAGLRQWCC